jgi:hypothetical protein
MPRKQKPKTGRAGTEYRFKIGAYTPQTMPMARLAEYMAELAVLLGEPSPINKIIYHRGDTVNPAEPVIKAGCTFGSHRFLPDKQNY